MIDLDLIRTQPDRVKQAAKHKGHDVDVAKIAKLDERHRQLQTQIDALRAKRNSLAVDEAKTQGAAIKHELQALEADYTVVDQELIALLLMIPNLPSDDTPVGPDETSNQVLREVGERPSFTFPVRTHWELGEALDLIDNARAAKVAGARFTYLKGPLAQLQFALIQYTLSVVTNRETLAQIIKDAKLSVDPKPFVAVIPPMLIKPEPFQRMARLEPRDERYHITGDDLYLIGSAEHTLGAMHMDETFVETDLPVRYVGYSTSFRREAGTYGKDTKGILRLHQFDKVELESFTTADTGLAEQNFLVAIQEYLVQQLGIAYRAVVCSTGDQGDPDFRHIDLDMWLPGEDTYRETHSADYMSDYQARRLNTRVKRTTGKTELVHTNDATAFAIGRTLIAIMENYQQSDGSIRVPDVLVPYAGFDTIRSSK